MFRHYEDGSELELKIRNDGTLVIHCPSCNRFWSIQLNTFGVTVSPDTGIVGGPSRYRTEIRSLTFPIERVLKLGKREYSEMLAQNSERIIKSVQEAFPEAIIKW